MVGNVLNNATLSGNVAERPDRSDRPDMCEALHLHSASGIWCDEDFVLNIKLVPRLDDLLHAFQFSC